MAKLRVGFALCASCCSYEKALAAVKEACILWDVTAILSETAAETDSRFGTSSALRQELETLTGRPVMDSIPAAEPIGGQKLLDVLVICPCTGNTLGKLAAGITDTAVTMAAKAHLRNERPVVLALTTNDGLSGSAENIGKLLNRRNVYFVPFGQDDPGGKPRSLTADFTLIPETVTAALEHIQLQPILK